MPVRVSVVVPVFNPGRYIDPLIDSLRRQTMPAADFEAVFVDDGSTDDTPGKLDRLAESEPNVTVVHIPNSGWPGRPRNIGIEAAAVEPTAPDAALATARESAPADVGGGEITRINGFAVGDRVAIAADDYGPEESRGTVVRLAPDEITILRHGPSAGDVAVHFPRAGYRVRKE